MRLNYLSTYLTIGHIPDIVLFMRMPNGHKYKKPFIVEIRFVPVSAQEDEDLSQRLMEALLPGAILYAQEQKNSTLSAV